MGGGYYIIINIFIILVQLLDWSYRGRGRRDRDVFIRQFTVRREELWFLLWVIYLHCKFALFAQVADMHCCNINMVMGYRAIGIQQLALKKYTGRDLLKLEEKVTGNQYKLVLWW